MAQIDMKIHADFMILGSCRFCWSSRCFILLKSARSAWVY